MPDISPLAALRLPPDLLASLDSRAFHYALQPVHHLVRLAHLVAMALFFGAIAALDLRLIGRRAATPLDAMAAELLPLVHAAFAITLASGIALFLYDPVHVGRHAYFVPKLLLLLAGLLNAAAFHSGGNALARACAPRMPLRARLAGALSLALWLGVIVCAALNEEAAPKVLLR
jgi:hypothetical protein